MSVYVFLKNETLHTLIEYITKSSLKQWDKVDDNNLTDYLEILYSEITQNLVYIPDCVYKIIAHINKRIRLIIVCKALFHLFRFLLPLILLLLTNRSA